MSHTEKIAKSYIAHRITAYMYKVCPKDPNTPSVNYKVPMKTDGNKINVILSATNPSTQPNEHRKISQSKHQNDGLRENFKRALQDAANGRLIKIHIQNKSINYTAYLYPEPRDFTNG